MNNILKIISKSWIKRPRTLRPSDDNKPAARYRGLVHIDTSKCLACSICDTVCVSGAIAVEALDDHLIWDYDPGRCTFCGRCVDHCPGEALSQEAERPASYGQSGALREVKTVKYPLCSQCGRPVQPSNERMLSAAFTEVSCKVRERARLCDRCRKIAAQADMKKGYSTTPDSTRSKNGN